MKNIKLCLFLAAAIICTGCKTQTNTSTVLETQSIESNSVEISVVTSYGGDDGNRQNYERAYKAYEAETGNTIKDNSGISNEEWKSNIMTAFNSGNEPDVLFFFTGADSNKLIADEKVVSLEEIRKVYPDYAGNMDDNFIPKSPLDGKSYAVPVNGYWEGLYVNKNVLADCGVDIPNADTDWEEFIADCQTIADKGYVPIAASLGEIPHYWLEFCILNNGGKENHTVIPSSSEDDSAKAWINGLYDIKELYDLGFFPEDTTTAPSVKEEALMTDNKAAFMIDGSWKMGWFADNAADINDFTVTYVPSKGERKPTDIIGGLSMGYFITKKAWDNPEKQAACVDFISAMTTDEVVASFGVTAVTALKNAISPPGDANSLVKDALEMNKNITHMVSATADGLLPNARNFLIENVKNIVTGSITAEEVIDSCLALNSEA